MSAERLGGVSKRTLWFRASICLFLGTVALVLRLLQKGGYVYFHPMAAAALFGGAVVAAAFLLAWAAEALQVDLGGGLSIALLAFIAVLPEYSVDLHFAWQAATDPRAAHWATANMTGANRLLLGVGWSVVVLVSTWIWRKSKASTAKNDVRKWAVQLAPTQAIDWVVLGMATLWSFAMPLMGRIAPWHGLVMLLIFVFYIWRLRGVPEEQEPELAGVASWIGHLSNLKRRLIVGGWLLFAGMVLLASSKPFADGLIETGGLLRIDKFLLVQWLAPLASEAPELLVAIIFSLRGQGQSGLTALLSSKVNQWTLLVGTLPLVYSLRLRRFAALPLDGRQAEELVLTATQSLLGLAMLSRRRLTFWHALVLLALFLVQLPFPNTHARYIISVAYAGLAGILFFMARRDIWANIKYVFGKKAIHAE